VRSVAFAPDGRRLATAGMDGSAKVWDTVRARGMPSVLKGHLDHTSGVAFSPDSRTLATGSRDGTVKLWDLGDTQVAPRELRTLRGHRGEVRSVDFSPGGTLL